MEATAGEAEVELLETIDTDLSESTCEVLAASTELVDRHIPTTEHPLLLLEDLALDKQMPPVCCWDKLQTGPALECIKWRTFGALC